MELVVQCGRWSCFMERFSLDLCCAFAHGGRFPAPILDLPVFDLRTGPVVQLRLGAT